jgi:PIN domain nuclease of toxin-antitoxin system
MALLLDTHAYLWFINDDPRMKAAVAKRLVNARGRVLVSVVSAWIS